KDDFVRVWDARTGKLTARVHHPRLQSLAGFIAGGRQLLTQGADTYRRWDLQRQVELPLPWRNEPTEVPTVHAGGGYLARHLGSGRELQLWELTTGEQVAAIGPSAFIDAGFMSRIHLASDGRTLVTIGNEVRLWQVPSLEPLTPPMMHTSNGSLVALSP